MYSVMELVKQELDDTTAYFDIPQEIQDFEKDVQTCSACKSILPGEKKLEIGKDIL